MEALELKAEPRTAVKGHAKELRQKGLVPVIMYGKGLETKPLQVEAKSLSRVLNVAGTHQLIALQIGNQEPRLSLAREIQRDPIRRDYLHVDFYVVKMDEKVKAQIPLVMVGVSPAVRDFSGILTQGLDELEIECLPADLIASIEVDISSLAQLDDTLTVADLKVPDTITVLSDPDSMVAKVEPPRLTEEEVEEEVSAAEPEVLTASKRQEQEEE
jgi:large subunit ribosomal protein L25